ncbi:MAG: hypothetical protein JAY74_21880 [Candidatus Thiodiazotropha taylori]|nr:hypothetical protein [Candidatus Thiodiazotropha taylori]
MGFTVRLYITITLVTIFVFITSSGCGPLIGRPLKSKLDSQLSNGKQEFPPGMYTGSRGCGSLQISNSYKFNIDILEHSIEDKFLIVSSDMTLIQYYRCSKGGNGIRGKKPYAHSKSDLSFELVGKGKANQKTSIHSIITSVGRNKYKITWSQPSDNFSLITLTVKHTEKKVHDIQSFTVNVLKQYY